MHFCTAERYALGESEPVAFPQAHSSFLSFLVSPGGSANRVDESRALAARLRLPITVVHEHPFRVLASPRKGLFDLDLELALQINELLRTGVHIDSSRADWSRSGCSVRTNRPMHGRSFEGGGGVSTGESFATGASDARVASITTAWCRDLPSCSNPEGGAACGRFQLDLAKATRVRNPESIPDASTVLRPPRLAAGRPLVDSLALSVPLHY
jgi:hypothetical protein